ncbi:hypothetical protein LOTGIDRAFT_222960 [Lottia gigantea]|uniref:NF-kappa-B inhibitor-interacting Ras-like protein 1 n=1 Tax=Lottia gigantea TaxID=225164 RepID=V4B3S2_LOTGI|nr:hypothetical protein LOTGIDRAFT_222960 [Lottia gigantea]ESO83034.1 hypothetical protein LOTGIDRAFT_222960 [Lottia gigantea]
MGKINKILVCGCTGVGKTSLIEQLLYGNHKLGTPMFATIEDIYNAVIETDRGVKERVRIYDTAGLDPSTEMPKHYFSFPDGFALVYDVTSWDSFQRLDSLKKEIEKVRDNKAHIIVIGNKSEVNEARQVEFNTALKWSHKEKIRLWEVSVANRQSLVEPFIHLTSKITQPPSKSTFLPGRKAKSTVVNSVET